MTPRREGGKGDFVHAEDRQPKRMGSEITSFWGNGFRGVPTFEAIFGVNWNPKEFFSDKIKCLFVAPAKNAASDPMHCIDSHLCSVGKVGSRDDKNKGRNVAEKKKCPEICQIQMRASCDMGRTYSAGIDGQGSPWAIQAVHIGNDEEDCCGGTEMVELVGVSEPPVDQFMPSSSQNAVAEPEIVAGFVDLDSDLGEPAGVDQPTDHDLPLCSEDPEPISEVNDGFAALDNPMFDSSSVENDCKCSDAETTEGLENLDVWDNPEFLENVDTFDRVPENAPPPVAAFMTENPMFEEGFLDKGVTSLRNPLFEIDGDSDCDHAGCSAATSSHLDASSPRANMPISSLAFGIAGSPDAATRELVDAIATAEADAEAAAAAQSSCWDGFDVETEPPTPRRADTEPACVPIALLVPRVQRCPDENTASSWISAVDYERRGAGVKGKGVGRRTCMGSLNRVSMAGLSAKVCDKVAWLFDCLLLACQNCFPAGGGSLPAPVNATRR